VILQGAARDRCPAEYLLSPLHHTDERVRREAVRALENLTDRRVFTLLLLALSDRSSAVRTAAARALGRRREVEALPELLKLVESRVFAGREPVEVEGFFEAVGALSDDRALPSLSRLWEDRRVHSRSSNVRVGAIRVLAAIGTPAALAELERARRSRNRNVREEAEHCLLRLKNELVPRCGPAS
jgi:HEAT repeat protein